MKKHLVYLNRGSDKYWDIEVTGNLYHITTGKTGTVGQSSVKTFNSAKDCTKDAEILVEEKHREGYIEREEDFIKRYELPSGVKESLHEERTVNTFRDELTLPRAEDIRMISVVVDHHQKPECPGPGQTQDNPFEKVKGLFCTTAYCLIRNTGEWHGSLVWLPLLEMYGLWNAETQQLYVFPNVAWFDIEKDIQHYLPLRNEHNSFPNIQCHVRIGDYFDFIPQDFSVQAQSILSLPVEIRRQKAEEFLVQYESRLLRHPFCAELEDPFRMLVKIYHFLGQSFEGETQYTKAVEWFERALLVLDQAPQFRKLYVDIFLQLSFCYMEMSKFNLSLLYIDQYQLYDPSASDACEQIRRSVLRIQRMYNEAMESYRKAMALGTAEYFEKAIKVTLQAIALAPNDPVLQFNLACFFSISGRTTEALYYLEQALKKGFRDKEKIFEDDDLNNIRCMREFESMLAKYFRSNQE